jgi:large subunit ribosomal protein L25
MAENVDLQAREREGRGKNAARRLRAQGMIPAVLYGDGGEEDGGNTMLAVPTKVVDYTLTHLGDNALYDVKLGGGRGDLTARIVDVQRNPLTGKLVHVDFTPVDMRERIVVTVPLAIVGESPGVVEGGVLDQVVYEVEVDTLPGDIPQEVTLDVSNLQLNEKITLADVALPEGVTLVSDPEEVAASVTPPTEITEEELEEAGIVEEPSEEEATRATAAPATAAVTEGEGARGVEGTETIPVEERETGPAGQNLQP